MDEARVALVAQIAAEYLTRDASPHGSGASHDLEVAHNAGRVMLEDVALVHPLASAVMPLMFTVSLPRARGDPNIVDGDSLKEEPWRWKE